MNDGFSRSLLAWHKRFGRKHLPWQSADPYSVWVSEIMLQQTQVQTVIAYFNRFIARFPTVAALANAPEDEVLSLWSGLGYYSRARNLHQAAKIITKDFQATLPSDITLLISLPGIGASTAAAIASLAFNQPTPILDANVKRVLARFFAVEGYPEQAAVNKKLWELARLCMSTRHCAEYTQAIMDLGALCCTPRNPDCLHCPLQKDCQAFKHNTQLLYPNKKIKKAIPTQHQQFLVLHNAQRLIYLEKRPPAGLWGGLWCLPALDAQACALEFIEKAYGFKGQTPQDLLQFKHSFSHFHLKIKALSIQVDALSDGAREGSGQWFAKEELQHLGLAKPMQVILSHNQPHNFFDYKGNPLC